MALSNNEEESNRPACAACRHQRKRCKGDCVLWRHFPATKMEDFQAVHRVFGISNISKMIKGLDAGQQDQAVKSFLWEAKLWKEDPVQGPLGRFNRLEEELRFLRNQINILQRQLITAAPPASATGYQSRGGSGAGNFSYHPNYTGQHRMSHGCQVPIQPNFGPTSFYHISNVRTQDVTAMMPSRPQQRLASLYNISFEQTNENALVNPYANVRINGQDRRSVIHVGDRTGNVVVPPGHGRSSNRYRVTEKHGDDQVIGHQTEDETTGQEAGDLAALYSCHQLLSDTNQNNVQDLENQSNKKTMEDPTWKKN